ncbi:hypothetical protein [Sphingomonas segetis]|jgi:hypothetical protein|uniref:hypothetical protein n=1 Tax=Sphingomonas segetis TaxID=1104779 RepID=UPI0012D2E50D|nr:hypothetical protein [Sphingomonas segetis]
MSRAILARYVTPWKFRRAQHEQRLAALRERDGDNCRRCRRPLRFDLPRGHDKAPRFEQIGSGAEALDNLCLCHVRCNAAGADVTEEVTERVRRKSEAELFARPRRVRKAG